LNGYYLADKIRHIRGNTKEYNDELLQLQFKKKRTEMDYSEEIDRTNDHWIDAERYSFFTFRDKIKLYLNGLKSFYQETEAARFNIGADEDEL
jgi:hypothetical protein